MQLYTQYMATYSINTVEESLYSCLVYQWK